MHAGCNFQLVVVPVERTDRQCSAGLGGPQVQILILMAAHIDLIHLVVQPTILYTDGCPTTFPCRKVPEPVGGQEK